MAEPKEGAKLADFKVHFGDAEAIESSPPPFRMCIAAHFGASEGLSTRSAPAERVMALDADRFDFVFEKFGPAFVLELPDPVDAAAPKIKAHLAWSKLAALRPNELVQGVPELRSLLEAHRVLERSDAQATPGALSAELARVLARSHWATAVSSLLGTTASQSAAREKGAPTQTPSPQASSGDDLGSLFDLVDTGPKAAEPPSAAAEPTAAEPTRSAASELVNRVLGGSPKKGANTTGLDAAKSWVRAAFARLLGSLLEHPETLRLEGLWRGLRFVLQSAQRSKHVELFVAWLGSNEAELEALLAQDFDVVCLDLELDDSTRAFDLLERMGELGEAHQTPVVLNVSPRTLGQPSFASLNKLQQTLLHVDAPALTNLQLESAKPGARWLALCGNELPVRSPHDGRSSRLSEIGFEQAATDSAYAEMPASFGVAALLLRSMARAGHPFAFVGAENGALSDLEVRHLGQPDFTIATSEFVNAEAQLEAAAIGVALWSPVKNRAIASLASAPLLFRGEEAARGAKPKARHPLSEAIFLSRLTRAVRDAKRRFRELPDEECARRTRQALLELFPNAAPPGPTVEVTVRDGKLQVSLDPRRYGTLAVSELTLELAR